MFEFLTGMLFGMSFWVVIATFIWLPLSIWSYEADNALGSLIGLILYAAVLQWVGGVPVWQSIVENPFTLVVILATYMAIGLLYGVFWKWRRYCASKADEIKKGLKEFEKYASSDEAADGFERSYHNPVKPSAHAERITNWIVFWPFGVIWTLLHDPVMWLGRETYRLAGSAVSSIANSEIEKVRRK